MKRYGRKTCRGTILSYLPQRNTIRACHWSLTCPFVGSSHFCYSRVTTLSIQFKACRQQVNQSLGCYKASQSEREQL